MLINKKIKLNNKKVLIITGHKSFPASGIKKYLDFYRCEIKLFYKKSKIPKLTELKNIIKKKNKFKPHVIIGIGGGSVLDISKMTAALKNHKISLNNNQAQFQKKLYLILVPTTAGSGSEATNFAVLYKGKSKYSLISDHMKADNVFFYTDSLKHFNKSSKLSSALDILCQSVESIFSINSNIKSLTFAKKSLTILNKNLSKYLKGNHSTFKNMFLASNYAGKAINITKTNVPHALSYYLTAKYKIDHGYAVYLNLFGFLSFLYKNKYKDGFLEKRFEFLLSIFLIKKNSINPLFLLFKKIKKIVNKDIDYKTFSINKFSETDKIIKNVNFERLNNCPIKLNSLDLKEIIAYK